MSIEIPIRVSLPDEQRHRLEKLCAEFDKRIDDPGSRTVITLDGLKHLGSQLWSAVEIDPDDLAAKLQQANEDNESVRLVFSDADTLSLPWELLFHGHDQLQFLAQQPRCCIVRRTRGTGDTKPTKTPGPLRILLFVSSPDGLDPESERLDYELEEQLLFEAIDRPLAKGEIELDVAEDGTIDTLFERLQDRHYHGVILSMHGTEMRSPGVDDTRSWGLLFEDPQTWGKLPIPAEEIVRRLNALSVKPDMIVLSACRSGKLFNSGGAITSVARQLHEAGVKHVLGMRLVVIDRAAASFSAKLFEHLAQGNSIAHSVSLARAHVASGEWHGAGVNKQAVGQQVPEDPFAQWTIPILLDRTADGPLLDRNLKFEPRPAPKPGQLMDGDNRLVFPDRSQFIGRRKQIRQHLRPFLRDDSPRLMFVGAGGVGKTTLAGWFARRLRETDTDCRVLGFQVPFDAQQTFTQLLAYCSAIWGEAKVARSLEQVPDIRSQIEALLLLLAEDRQHPLAIVLDNLEDLQQLETLSAVDPDGDSFWFVRAVLGLPRQVRMVLTGRYQFPELAGSGLNVVPIDDVPLGDVLRRMNRLGWPNDWTAKQKSDLYRQLGGNHRALEWLSQLLTGSPDMANELIEQMEKCEAPPQTSREMTEVVLQAMRENLLLDRLLASLSPDEHRLLYCATLPRVPVLEDAYQMMLPRSEPIPWIKSLQDRSLLESGDDRRTGLEYHTVSSLVSTLLADAEEEVDVRQLHRSLATYFEYQAANVSRTWADDVEAIYHYRRGDDHLAADRLAEPLANFHYRFSNFAAAAKMTEEIVNRSRPPAPWWALVRHGMCLHVFGKGDAGLQCFLRAKEAAPDHQSLGTTLNNISQIYKARGDYETALDYLQKSLKIRQEIGDKSGEGTTLNNLATTAHAKGDYETALDYLQKSLKIRQEIGDKSGEGTTLNNISQIYKARGDYETALDYLQKSLKIQQEIGDKSGEGTTLNNISQIYKARGDYETALDYLQKSLKIRQEIGDKSGEGTTLNNISQIFKARGDYETALDYLQKSLKIRQEIGDKSGEGTTLNNISQIYDARGDYETALDYLQKSLKITQEIGDKRGEGGTLNNISQIYDARGDYDTALDCLQKSLKIQQEIGDKSGEGTTLNNISQIFNARGDYETALDYLQKSLKITQEIGDKSGMIATLHNMASIALQNKQGEDALRYWGQALQLAMETQNAQGIFHVAGTLGMVIANNEPDQAKQLLQMAIDVGRRAGMPGVDDYEAVLSQLGGAE